MRADGKRLRNTDPMYTVASYVMSKRVDSMNMVTLDIPYDPIQEYLNKKRKESVSLSHLGVIIAAYLRTAAEFPLLNRFIMNCKPYARNEFCVAMVVLKSGQMDNGTMSKMYFNMTDTIFDVNNTINKYVTDNREVPEKNGTEKMIKILLGAPGVLRVGVGLFKFMDKHGLLPKKVIDMSPFHNSLCISNLASIRTNHIYHHCYEFGTTSVFVCMGKPVQDPLAPAGTRKKLLPLGVVMDERVATGIEYSRFFAAFERYLKRPELLEVRLDGQRAEA